MGCSSQTHVKSMVDFCPPPAHPRCMGRVWTGIGRAQMAPLKWKGRPTYAPPPVSGRLDGVHRVFAPFLGKTNTKLKALLTSANGSRAADDGNALAHAVTGCSQGIAAPRSSFTSACPWSSPLASPRPPSSPRRSPCRSSCPQAPARASCESSSHSSRCSRRCPSPASARTGRS